MRPRDGAMKQGCGGGHPMGKGGPGQQDNRRSEPPDT
jgi:hypothetical protein